MLAIAVVPWVSATRIDLAALLEPVRRVGDGARVGEHESANARAVPSPERERDVAAHRQPDDDRALDLQRVEHRGDVVGVAIHRVRRRCGRVTEAAEVDRNAARFGDERADLRLPHRAIQRKGVQKHHRQSRADVVERDLRVVDECDHSGSGHAGACRATLREPAPVRPAD